MILIHYHFSRDTQKRQNWMINYESKSKTNRFECSMHHLINEWRSVFELRSLLCALKWIVEWSSMMKHLFRSCENTHRRRVLWKSNRRNLLNHFKVLKIICKIEFELILDIFATIIAYTWRRNSWYRSIISIEWWISIKTMLILIFIFAAYCLNSRTINCLFAFDVIKSSDSRYVLIQQTRSWFHTCRAIIFFNYLSIWKRIVSFIKCRIDLFNQIWSRDKRCRQWHWSWIRDRSLA
jgi:hypothetical protein